MNRLIRQRSLELVGGEPFDLVFPEDDPNGRPAGDHVGGDIADPVVVFDANGLAFFEGVSLRHLRLLGILFFDCCSKIYARLTRFSTLRVVGLFEEAAL